MSKKTVTVEEPVILQGGEVTFVKDGVNRPMIRTNVHVDDLIAVFDPQKNVRDSDNMEAGYSLTDFAREIATDGEVREPVQLALDPRITLESAEKMDKKEIIANLIEPLKGFRRVHALHKAVHDFQIGGGRVNPYAPVVIHIGFEMKDILSYRLDHGSQKSLNDWEIMLCVREMEESGIPYKGWEITWKLRHLFAAAVSNKVRAEWQNDLTALEKKGAEENWSAEKILGEQQKATFAKFKGRYQKCQRLALSPHDELRQAFYAETYGKEFPFKLTNERLLKSYEAKPEDFKKMSDEWKASDNMPEDPKRHWTLKTLEEKSNIYKPSIRMGIIFSAILGDTASQERLAQLRDQMILEEKARQVDPDVYDNFIKAQAGKAIASK